MLDDGEAEANGKRDDGESKDGTRSPVLGALSIGNWQGSARVRNCLGGGGNLCSSAGKAILSFHFGAGSRIEVTVAAPSFSAWFFSFFLQNSW